jgi:RNA polymerase sigma factor (sigma-70 family)
LGVRTQTTDTALSQVSDKELLAQIAERDQAAGSEIFNRYADEIYGFLARRASPAESEDLLQEVFVRALRGASRFRGESSVRTWLYAIARYTLFERHRARIDGESFVDLTDAGPGPESLAIGGEERKKLVAALDQLPDEQAVVLELYRIDGLSHDEIGRLLGIQASTSRKRLERAAKGLKKALLVAPSATNRHSQIASWRESLLRRVLPKDYFNDASA